MALGFGKKKSDSSSPSSSPSTEKANPELSKDGVFSGDQTSAENGGKKPRKMNRIDGPITKPIGGENLNDDSTDSDVSIGKQMEKEAGNAIKYRTCSWQKVRYPICLDPFVMELSSAIVCEPLITVASSLWLRVGCAQWRQSRSTLRKFDAETTF